MTVPAVGGKLFTPVSDGASVGDEPNVATGGTFATPYRSGPATYPEDDNGIAEAREGISPVRILEMRPATSSTLDGSGSTHAGWLLTPFLGQDFVDPQNEFRAVFGDWADYNQDGVIQNDRWEEGDLTGDARVRGHAFAGEDDEWNGVEAAEFQDGWTLVTYQTGFAQPQRTDLIPGINDGFFLGEADGAGPSQLYRGDNGDGYFVTLIGAGLGRTNHDNQFIVTVVTETFIGLPVLDSDGRRFAPVEGQPYDVDVYQSVSGGLEAVYTQTVVGIGTRYHEANETVAGGTAPLDPVLEPVNDLVDAVDRAASEPTNPVAGAVVSAVFPTFASEQQDADTNPSHDYTAGWHPWVDVKNNYGATAQDALGLGLSTFEVAPTADGRPGQAPGMLFPRIGHGLWYDKDADGFINDHVNDEPAPGCPDQNDCGLGGNEASVATHAEWAGACPNLSPRITYSTVSGTWGPTGVYLVKNANAAISDVQDDGEVDRLVTAGDIVLSATCNAGNSPFQSFADEAILFPAGNPDFDIKAETLYCTSMVIVGIPLTECTTDVDWLRAYAT